MIFDDEFGICLDPCEHPSINGGVCAVCGERIEPNTPRPLAEDDPPSSVRSVP